MDERHLLLTELLRVMTADAGLSGLIAGRVFDAVPQGAEHPFVAIGEVTTAPLDGDAVPSLEHRIAFDAVSRVGRRQASEIADRIATVLSTATMQPAGLGVVALRHVGTTVTGARDGRSWRARVRLRAVTDGN